MGLRFTVLASGSAGNASLVQGRSAGILIDAGLGARALGQRLAAAGASWASVNAVLLTHTHTDHWNDGALAEMLRRDIRLYCHPEHHRALGSYGDAFAGLKARGLVYDYEAGEEVVLASGLRGMPFAVRHDSGPTFGFRIEGGGDLFGDAQAVGYASDLGCWDAGVAAALADVDVLAVEFNHDVQMECRSRRGPQLIMRVLGDEGHLSNEQAAALVAAILQQSAPGRLRHLVQLHLSRECNRPALAAEAARLVLAALAPDCTLHTATQNDVSATIDLGSAPLRRRAGRRGGSRRATPALPLQPWLPGLEPV